MSNQLEITKISRHGGARRGAGRKSKYALESRQLFNYEFDKHFPEILEKSIELAKKGDKEMIKMLLEQRLGRPAATMNIQDSGNNKPKQIYNFFFDPEVRKATEAYEHILKEKIRRDALGSEYKELNQITN